MTCETRCTVNRGKRQVFGFWILRSVRFGFQKTDIRHLHRVPHTLTPDYKPKILHPVFLLQTDLKFTRTKINSISSCSSRNYVLPAVTTLRCLCVWWKQTEGLACQMRGWSPWCQPCLSSSWKSSYNSQYPTIKIRNLTTAKHNIGHSFDSSG